MKNYDLFHEFAQQKKERGVGASCSYLENKVYSYDEIIGLIVPNTQIIIINNQYYSRTTSKHQAKLFNATSHFKQILITQIQCENELKELIKKFNNSRKLKESYKSKIFQIVQNFNDTINIISEYKMIKYLKEFSIYDFDYSVNEIFKEFCKNNSIEVINVAATLKKYQNKLKRDKIKKQKETINKFMNFDINYINDLEFCLLRFNAKTEKVETTKQVSISKKNCLKLYELLNKLYSSNKLNKLQNKHFLNYTLTKIDKKETVINCHTFQTKYLLEFGKQLKAM